MMMSSPAQCARDGRMSINRLLIDDSNDAARTYHRPSYDRTNTFGSDVSPTHITSTHYPNDISIRFEAAQPPCPRTAPWWSARDRTSEGGSSRSTSFSRHDSVHYGPVSPAASIESEENRCQTGRKLPRPPRPSYNEEQRFCIMYLRIVRDKSWPEIEDKFAELFNTRSKGGLTSVYYRIRKNWGLKDVLRSGPDKFDSDRRIVVHRATNFSHDFLAALGYFDLPTWSR